MPVRIIGPDGVPNNFPDGTPDDVIKQAMRKQYPQPAQHVQGSKYTPGTLSDDPDYQPPTGEATQTDRGIFLPLTVTRENGKDKAGIGVPGFLHEPYVNLKKATQHIQQGLPSDAAIDTLRVARDVAIPATKFPMGKTAAPSRVPAEAAADRARRMLREEATTGTRAATTSDLQAGAQSQITEATKSGQDLRLLDVGGENTRGLMRWAANTSPKARELLQDFLNPRYRTQNERVSNWLRNATNNPQEAFQAIDAIKEAARDPNAQAYKEAFTEGKNGLSDEQGNQGFMQMFNSAWGKEVMREATSRWERKRVAGTTGGFSDFVQGGKNRGRYTLAFWDQVKRVLDSQSQRAKKANDLEEKRDIDGLRGAMLKRLDEAFPKYAQARGIAAKAFQATDAVEAGEKLMDINWTAAMIEKVRRQTPPQEWGRVQLGFLSEYFLRLNSTADRVNIVDRLLNNPLDRARMDAVMGRELRENLSAVLATEALMQRANAALGNSTTARQLAEMIRHNLPEDPSLAQQALRMFNWSPRAILTHFLGQRIAARRAAQRTEIDHATADHVAELLLSKDPALYAQAVQTIAKTPGMLDNLAGWYRVTNQNRALQPVTQSIIGSEARQQGPQEQPQPGMPVR